jgi:hypothetical protein
MSFTSSREIAAPREANVSIKIASAAGACELSYNLLIGRPQEVL